MSNENQLDEANSAHILAELLLDQERIRSEGSFLRKFAKIADRLASVPSQGSGLKYLGGLSDRDKYYR